ncbi:mitochondrial sodium/calcium exchanger protein [Drosophila kikkawai]|uniref:Mitochondrial sodium/calcium exchanger protein n=1 Tax=Drosophila kikkawai TaxID=30033 RepID=A0A6P4IM87_DROKI|nr:mitochondrial sodium/calcium exchanger protein [Drosophila kikkawai]
MSNDPTSNAFDDEFTHFWEKVNCFVAREFPYEEKCDFVSRAVDCNRSTNVIPYMLLMSCKLKCINAFQEHCVLALFGIMCFFMLTILINVVYNYYGPALESVSKLIHLNEHLAGVTILAFGNSSADLFANLANIRSKVPVYSASISSALFVSMVSGGIICYITPFRMNGFETVRDILFLIFGLSLVNFFLMRETEVSSFEFIVMFLVYIFYIVVNVVDLYLMRREVKIINAKIDELEDMEDTEENDAKMHDLKKTLNRFQDHKLEIYEKRRQGSMSKMQFTTQRMTMHTRISVNQEQNRNAMYDRRRGKNFRLFKDFLLAVRPFRCRDWRTSNMVERAILLAKVPAVLLCVFYIPLVDYQKKKHGWKKLLNIVHVVVNPAITVMVFKAVMLTPGDKLWYIEIIDDLKSGAYTMAITVPIAVCVFFTSRTDKPPSYHWVFTIMNLTGCMLLIYVSATEIDRVIEVISRNLELDEEFMSASVKSWTNNLGPLVANTALAMQGYPKMAYASSIGGPIFTIVLSPSIVLFVRRMLNENDENITVFGNYGHDAFYFLLFGLTCTLLWTTTLGFFARRSMGVFSITLYAIYLLYIELIHFNIIHTYGYDQRIRPGFGDL